MKVFIVSLCLWSLVLGDIDLIIKQCREDWCYGLDHNDSRYQGEEYFKKLFKLIGSGISQFIYENGGSLVVHSNVSESCKTSFKRVDEAIGQGEEWAFRMIDSSGKTPPAFLQGTVTELADYDECVDIISTDETVNGMYCMTDIFPMGYKGKIPRTDGQVSLNSMQHINNSAYYFGLCFPDGCNSEDVRVIMNKVLEPFPLKVYGDHSCNTRKTDSLLYRLKNIRIGSVIAFIFLFSTVSLVAWGTFNHVLRPDNKELKYLRSFSIIENTFKLFYVDPNGRPETYLNLYAFTYFKMFCVVCGVAAHVMACIELPLGFMLLSHHKELEKLMSTPALMSIFGDAGIVASTSLTGFGTMMMTYSVAKAGKLPYIPVVIERAVRFMLPILAVMSFDLIWYLPFSGPFASRVGEVLVDKCSKFWWRSVLHISTLFEDPIEICSGHTYSLAVDVQLFAIGIPAVILLAKRPKIGILYSLSWMVFGVTIGYYYVLTQKLTPTMMVARNPSIYELEMFLKYIHMATSGYLFSYFSAMLAAFAVCNGFLDSHARNINHVFWLSSFFFFATIAQYAPILTNYFDIVSREYIPLFVVTVRIIVAIELVFFCTYLALLDLNVKFKEEEEKKKKVSQETDQTESAPDQGSSSVTPSKKQFSCLKAFFRLSFSIYMCNYLFIRTDFYTTRHVFYTSLWVYVSLTISFFL